MWIAKDWNEYEVIDTSKGEKLERWGDYLLVRPAALRIFAMCYRRNRQAECTRNYDTGY